MGIKQCKKSTFSAAVGAAAACCGTCPCETHRSFLGRNPSFYWGQIHRFGMRFIVLGGNQSFSGDEIGDFGVQNEEFCIQNDEFCIQNDTCERSSWPGCVVGWLLNSSFVSTNHGMDQSSSHTKSINRAFKTHTFCGNRSLPSPTPRRRRAPCRIHHLEHKTPRFKYRIPLFEYRIPRFE